MCSLLSLMLHKNILILNELFVFTIYGLLVVFVVVIVKLLCIICHRNRTIAKSVYKDSKIFFFEKRKNYEKINIIVGNQMSLIRVLLHY